MRFRSGVQHAYLGWVFGLLLPRFGLPDAIVKVVGHYYRELFPIASADESLFHSRGRYGNRVGKSDERSEHVKAPCVLIVFRMRFGYAEEVVIDVYPNAGRRILVFEKPQGDERFCTDFFSRYDDG